MYLKKIFKQHDEIISLDFLIKADIGFFILILRPLLALNMLIACSFSLNQLDYDNGKDEGKLKMNLKNEEVHCANLFI